MQDLFLHFKFTDRGGNGVFDIYPGKDNLTMDHRLGELRLDPNTMGEPTSARDKMQVCWKHMKGIKCNCARCVADSGAPDADVEKMWVKPKGPEGQGGTG